MFVIPWEDKKTSRFISFFLTFYYSIFAPHKFFHDDSKFKENTLPLVYAIISITTGVLFSNLYKLIIENHLNLYNIEDTIEYFTKLKVIFLIPSTLLISPVLVLVLIYVFSFLYFVLFYIFTNNSKEFIITKNIFCYAVGASFLLNAIPFIGGILCVISSLTLLIIGFSNIFRISKLYCALILFSPFLFFIILSIAILMGYNYAF